MIISSTNTPSHSGVYFFKDGNGHILYIGKASNLRSRVSSYKKNGNPRIQKMVELASRVDWQKTDSEIEALILESQLIKKYRPKFNIMLRDDKQYFYVVFTKENFPRIFITHQPKEAQNAKLKTQSNNSKLKIFNPKSIWKLEIGNWKFNSASAEFVGPFTDGTALKTALRLFRRIFPYCTCKQKHNNFCLNYHIGNCPGFCCLKNSEARSMKNEAREYGKSIKAVRSIMSGKKKSVIGQFKKEMSELGKKQALEKALILRNKIEKLDKVFENAQIIQSLKTGRGENRALAELKSLLKLKNMPLRIEGYDISNIQGEFSVGAMIVFSEGKPDKSQYRKFKIHQNFASQNLGGQVKTAFGDVQMLKQVLIRRFNHPEWPFPDLIIVDGGKGQLNTAEAIISNFQFPISKQINIIALTKDERHRGSHIYIRTTNHKLQTTNLSDMPPAVRNLILSVDSEAHRFAISYYRKLHRL